MQTHNYNSKIRKMERKSSSLKHKLSDPATQSLIGLNMEQIIFELSSPNLKSANCRALRVTNKTKGFLQFKIKCTLPFHYIVKPFEGTIEPRETIDVNVKMLLSDRNIFKFKYDKFEILVTPVREHVDPKSKVFWENAESYKLPVVIVETYEKVESVNPKPLGDMGNSYSQPVKVNEQQVQELESEVMKLKERVDQLKRRNKQAGLLNTWNFVVMATVSFALGFLFS